MAEGQRVDPFGAFVAAMEDDFIATLASSFLDKSPQCLAYFGLDQLCRFANSNFSRIFGLDPAAAGSTTLAGIMGQVAGDRFSALEAGVRAGDTVTFNLSALPPARDRTEVTGSLIPHFNAAGAVIGYIAAIEDVTDRNRALDTLLRREKFVTSLLDAAVDGILTIDARGVIQSVNRSCCRMFGFDEIELVGAPIAMLMPNPHQHRHAAYVDNYMSSGRAKIIGTGREVLAKRKDGSVLPIHLTVGEMRFADEVTFIGIARDVSDRHAAEERARFLTNHDPLTGLLTRRAFLEQCDREMAVRLPSGDMTHVVFSFDVDQFREINEGLGYHVGDGVLKAIVNRFGEVLPRDNTTLCRVGADEFAALACFPSRIAAEEIADQVHARLLSPIYVDRQLVLVRMSIGAAVYDPSIKRVEELLTKAELALQTVQHQGGNGVCFYTPKMAVL